MSPKDFPEFINHLTENARNSLRHADALSRGFGSPFIGTEHILLGVLSEETSVASKMLENSGVTLKKARTALNLSPKTVIIGTADPRPLSETAKLTLNMSWQIAQEFNQEFCGTEHILYSILNQKNTRAVSLLRGMSIDHETLLAEVESYLGRQQYEFDSGVKGSAKTKKRKGRGNSLLEFFGVDITEKARKGELDPVVGREPQIKRMITILNRRTKNNPVLIGEPGVGKTAIVEGLAQLIVSEEVPDAMLDKRVVTLDLAGMIAGTKYRGEFEERLKRVMNELLEDSNTIIFIDEMHLLVGAGAAEGAIDAANILKPALSRGDIQVIGATTLDEYSKYIEKDAALERRFQPIIVPEATLSETIAILRGLKKHYEDYHGVTIEDEVVVDAANLAKRYVNDRFMPDKAIDLIDEASAHARVERGKTPKNVRRLMRELKIITARMDDAVDGEDYERAAKYKTRMSQIANELDDQKAKYSRSSRLKITSDDIATVVATTTGVPVSRVKKSEAKYLTNLEKHLSKHVVGQGKAVKAVAKAIRRSRSGISDSRRPVGSFIFLGPTGVGKTELARVLAREVYASEDALVKIDMSEFSEKHNVSRLVGAPAGYVGYEEGGQLTDRIRRNPYSLVLFDEIEKAHPEVFNILLQILEDGYLSDAKGRKIDFTNTIVIMTSNIGADKLRREAALGFRARTKDDKKELVSLHQENREMVLEDLSELMRPELLNRIDNTIVFNALSKNDVATILKLQLKDLEKRLGNKNIGIKLTLSARARLAKLGYDPANGVRPLRRVLQEEVEDAIAEGLISEEYNSGDVISVAEKGSKLSFSLISE